MTQRVNLGTASRDELVDLVKKLNTRLQQQQQQSSNNGSSGNNNNSKKLENEIARLKEELIDQEKSFKADMQAMQQQLIILSEKSVSDEETIASLLQELDTLRSRGGSEKGKKAATESAQPKTKEDRSRSPTPQRQPVATTKEQEKKKDGGNTPPPQQQQHPQLQQQLSQLRNDYNETAERLAILESQDDMRSACMRRLEEDLAESKKVEMEQRGHIRALRASLRHANEELDDTRRTGGGGHSNQEGASPPAAPGLPTALRVLRARYEALLRHHRCVAALLAQYEMGNSGGAASMGSSLSAVPTPTKSTGASGESGSHRQAMVSSLLTQSAAWLERHPISSSSPNAVSSVFSGRPIGTTDTSTDSVVLVSHQHQQAQQQRHQGTVVMMAAAHDDDDDEEDSSSSSGRVHYHRPAAAVERTVVGNTRDQQLSPIQFPPQVVGEEEEQESSGGGDQHSLARRVAMLSRASTNPPPAPESPQRRQGTAEGASFDCQSPEPTAPVHPSPSQQEGGGENGSPARTNVSTASLLMQQQQQEAQERRFSELAVAHRTEMAELQDLLKAFDA